MTFIGWMLFTVGDSKCNVPSPANVPSRVADSKHHAEMQMDLVLAKVKFVIKEKRVWN